MPVQQNSSDQGAPAPAPPDWLSLDPEIMVKVAACLATPYEKAALRLTCKQWKWAMNQAVTHVPMVLECERPWGQLVPPDRIQAVCRTFPSLKHLDLTATASWNAGHLQGCKFLQGLDLNADYPSAFPQLQGLPHIRNVQIINVFKDYPEGRCSAQPGTLDTLCRLAWLTCLAFWRVDFTAYTDDSPLTRLTCLQELSFSYCHIPELLRGEAFPRQLPRLDLRGCHLGPHPLQLPKQLCTLDFSGTNISSVDLRRQIAGLHCLHDLRVYIHDSLKSKGVDFLSHLAEKLTRLELDRVCFGVQAETLHIGNLTALRHLDIDSSWLVDGTANQLSRLSCLTHLRLRDASWGHLSTAEYHKASSKLAEDLKRCSLGFLATLEQLRVLNLYNFQCLEEAWMSGLSLLTGLQDLNLGHQPRCVRPGLAQLSRLQALTALNLEWNSWLQDSDLEFLTQLTALHSLTVANCMLLGPKCFSWMSGLLRLRCLDISNLDCGLAGLRDLTAKGIMPRLDQLVISGCVSQYAGAEEGLDGDVLDVLAAAVDSPGSRLSKIVFEDLFYLFATRDIPAHERPLLIDFYQDLSVERATKLAYIRALERLQGAVGVCKVYGTRADQKVLRYSVDDKQKSDWAFAGLRL